MCWSNKYFAIKWFCNYSGRCKFDDIEYQYTICVLPILTYKYCPIHKCLLQISLQIFRSKAQTAEISIGSPIQSSWVTCVLNDNTYIFSDACLYRFCFGKYLITVFYKGKSTGLCNRYSMLSHSN